MIKSTAKSFEMPKNGYNEMHSRLQVLIELVKHINKTAESAVACQCCQDQQKVIKNIDMYVWKEYVPI